MRFRPGVQTVGRSLGFAVTFLSSVGCTPVPDRALHTVDDYRASAQLRKREYERCANDPGSLRDSPDCVNVREAARFEGMSLRDLPPLQLPVPSTDAAKTRTPSPQDAKVE
jgi:hypothetical protein